MPKDADFSRISGFAVSKVLSAESLELFIKRLEKEYYANVNVRGLECDEDRYNLVIEFQFNLTLVEFLYHVQKRHLGQLIQTETNDLKDRFGHRQHLSSGNSPGIWAARSPAIIRRRLAARAPREAADSERSRRHAVD